ncbi:hypothetical protein GCM10011348_45750 [Marinobacterium nitratireducens]|uniref:Uncharacterized protein n=1 Tax=Marinobacterium nitratireducens TaxID=518897 RepID=A0A918DZ08_9GAMM|nr:hypothetical protein [Marinobacterium nitratireducens]GGO89007.1 hypothetical protein GCM10011348_45750 [Marinobacterium nitratireducens]
MAIVTTSLFGDLYFIPAPGAVTANERLEWLTDLEESFGGDESPLESRPVARQRLGYDLPALADGVIQRAANALVGGLASLWAVPVWPEIQTIGAHAGGFNNISIDTTVVDLREDSLALLWGNPDNWQIVEISAVAADSITFTPVSAAYSNLKIIPVRVGRMIGSRKRPAKHQHIVVRAQWEVDDVENIATTVPTQFLGNDFYTDRVVLPSAMPEHTLERDLQVADFNLGPTNFYSAWDHNKKTIPQHRMMHSLAEVRAFRSWLYRRAGRYRPYWEPSWEHDLRLNDSGSLTTTITVYPDDYEDQAEIRTHIAIEAGGVWYPRTITTVTPVDADHLDLTLDTSLGGIDASTVTRISYLGLKRLDSDAIELDWLGAGNCQCDLKIKEIQP